ncbi:MAG: ATP-binding protein [Candidatus Caenarcaniphilales bacterium]|nr:ATP-binding protein [Candidatus Caenarcaniphilales bacterium]
MIKRDIEIHLNEISSQYPVITITGPRQTGKTFLAKHFFKAKPYFNLEDLELRDFAQSDPKAFLKPLEDGAIIDEIQHVPNLMSYIQVKVDENRDKKAQFILTGSQQFSMMQNISQSLAGRTSIINLLPCSLSEIYSSKRTKEVKDFKNKLYDKDFLIYNGFYPAIFKDKINPSRFYADYVRTYLERDLNQLSQIENISLFRKFLRACAARTGQLLNKESISNDVGIDASTVERWISILEASYILFRLEPYHANINKRLIKSPKIYFYDTGLASFLLDIESEGHVSSHPLKGNLFENMIVMEFLKARFNQGKTNNLNFYRDKSKEVDLILRDASKFTAVEIKYSETIKESLWSSLDYLSKLFPNECKQRVLVYGGQNVQERTDLTVFPFSHISLV